MSVWIWLAKVWVSRNRKGTLLRMREYKMTYPAGDVSLDLVGKGVGEQEQAVHPQAQHQERHNLGRARVEGDPDQGSQSHA
jgi:hypothetical protein